MSPTKVCNDLQNSARFLKFKLAQNLHRFTVSTRAKSDWDQKTALIRPKTENIDLSDSWRRQ